MLQTTLLLVGLLFSGLLRAEINYDLTADSISAQIKQRGAGPVAQEIFSDHTAMNIVLLSIDAATPEWLALAKQLGEAVEGQTRAMIGMAVGEGLQWNSAGVLSWQQTLFPLQSLCGLEGLYEWRTLSQSLALVALDRRIAALQQLQDESLKAQRSACLLSLEQAKQYAGKLLNNRP